LILLEIDQAACTGDILITAVDTIADIYIGIGPGAMINLGVVAKSTLVLGLFGVALGDLLSDGFGIGLVWGALMTVAICLLLALAHCKSQLNGRLLFWIAFVLTRPFGV
jgi:hypothetical protein